MRIWTVRTESFIFCRRTPLNSQNSIRKKFEQVGEIPEISPIWEDEDRFLDQKMIVFERFWIDDDYVTVTLRDFSSAHYRKSPCNTMLDRSLSMSRH